MLKASFPGKLESDILEAFRHNPGKLKAVYFSDNWHLSILEGFRQNPCALKAGIFNKWQTGLLEGLHTVIWLRTVVGCTLITFYMVIRYPHGY